MSLNVYDFVLKQGETFQKEMVWKDNTGAIIDITGYTARMQLRVNASDAAAAVSMTTENGKITITGADGKITLNLSASETAALSGSFLYDLEIVNGSTVTRLLQGRIKVDPEITR
jgi:tRNA threonylcarbamoyladenosine modification (KEOPS) complex  Pcc1 subunit